MRPSTLWRHRRPLLRWGLFLVALATVAAGLYVTLPAEPRWEVVSEPRDVFNAGNGRIAAYRAGPVQLLDAATGREIAKFLADAATLEMPAHSPDGRYFVGVVRAAQPNPWHIRGVDLHEQREWQVDTPVPPVPVTFSPDGAYLALRDDSADDDKEQYYIVRDAKSGRIVARVRILGSAYTVAFSRDSSAFLLHYLDEDKFAHNCAVSTRTGQAVTLDGGITLAVARNARCIIADRGKEGVWVGDLPAGSWRCRLEQAHAEQLTKAQHEFINDEIANRMDRARLRWRGDGRLWAPGAVVRKTGGRSILANGPDRDGAATDCPAFSPDGRWLLWCEMGKAGQVRFALYDVRTGEPRWRRIWTPHPTQPLFTPDSSRIVVPLPDTGQVEVLDAATGVTERTIALPAALGEAPQFRCDGRTLAVDAMQPEDEPSWLWNRVLEWLPNWPELGPMMSVRIFDVATGDLVGETAVEATSEWWLTDDRRGIIAVYGENDENGPVATVICCWDVPPRKPLRWILGMPLALGVGLVSLRYGWRRWRRRCTPTAAAQARAHVHQLRD